MPSGPSPLAPRFLLDARRFTGNPTYFASLEMATSTLWTALYRDGVSVPVTWSSLPSGQWGYVSLVARETFGGDIVLMANGLTATGGRRLAQAGAAGSTSGMVRARSALQRFVGLGKSDE